MSQVRTTLNRVGNESRKKVKAKKPKRKKQGSTAIDAKIFNRGAGGGKGAGRVKVTKSISLAKAAQGDSGTVNARITRDSDSFSPADRAETRRKKREEGPQLGKRLAAIASSIGPGKSRIGRAISGGLSGAAVGATIGEEIDRSRKAKAKKKKKDGTKP